MAKKGGLWRYLPVYLLLSNVIASYRLGHFSLARFTLYLIAVSGVFDVSLTKKRGYSIANWILIAIIVSGVLIWRFWTEDDKTKSVLSMFSVCALIGLLIWHFKHGLWSKIKEELNE